MIDIRAVSKVFLDFVYEQEMLPIDIIKIIDENDSKNDPEYSVKWDIRAILDLLKYKEKYKPGNTKQKTYQIKNKISEMCYLLSDRECDSLLREWLVRNNRQIGDAVDFCNDFFHNVKNDSGIKTFCTNLRELIENSKIEQASDYIKEIDDIINNCAFSQTYPIFEGTFDQFYEYLSGYIRNKVQQLTKKYKKNGCEYCGSTDKEIEAAHKNESDRKSITSDIFAKLAKKLDDNNAVINVKYFADEINSIHSNPDNFHFLCRECHEKYHKGEISDEMLVNKSVSNSTESETTINTTPIKLQKHWPFKNNSKGAINFCKSKGLDIKGKICFASVKKQLFHRQEVFWADNNDKIFLDNDWCFLLNNQNKKCLHVIYIPKGFLTPDLEKAARNKGLFDWNISTHTFIDVKSQFDLKKFGIKDVPYNEADIKKFDIKNNII